MKIVSPYSFKFGPEHMESNSQEVLTVPGQSMTPKELLRRFGAGMPLEGQEGIYENDDFDDIEDPTRNPDFDLTDIPDYLEKVKEKKLFQSKKGTRAQASTITPEPDSSPAGGLPEGTGAGEAIGPKVTDGGKPAVN